MFGHRVGLTYIVPIAALCLPEAHRDVIIINIIATYEKRAWKKIVILPGGRGKHTGCTSCCVPGPPWNSAQIFGNSAIASRKRSTSARKITSWRSNGSCTPRTHASATRRAIGPLPSAPWGIDERPASMMMKEKGVQFQISSVTAASAIFASDSQATLNCVPDRRLMMSLMGPLWHHLRGVGDHDRHDQHRQDEDDEQRLAVERLIHQVGQQEAEDEAADRRCGCKNQRAQDRPAEPLVGEHLPEQLKTDEIGLPPRAEIDRPLVEREIELKEQHRQQHQREQHDQRAEDRPAEAPIAAVARPAGWRAAMLRWMRRRTPVTCYLRRRPVKVVRPLRTTAVSMARHLRSACPSWTTAL